jgi:hypothetical protein
MTEITPKKISAVEKRWKLFAYGHSQTGEPSSLIGGGFTVTAIPRTKKRASIEAMAELGLDIP